MDLTHLFKAGVMTVKLQRKGDFNPPVPDKNRILPKSKISVANKTITGQRDEFSKQAKDVCNKITTLRNVLLENRSAYMRIGQHLKRATTMTDEQRDLIDRESEKFVIYYTQHIAQMRADWKRVKRKPQQVIHMEAVLDLLSDYLRTVQQIYLDQKRYRAQYELETYRLLKLAADKKKIPVRPGTENSGKRVKKLSISSNGNVSKDDNESDYSSDLDLSDGWESDSNKKLINTKKKSNREQRNIDGLDNSSTSLTTLSKSEQAVMDDDIQKSQQLVDEEEAKAKELSPEDVQMFEEENEQLYSELQGLSEEVDQIGKNVVDIAHLQDIFTEKVSMQQNNIERIANAVIGSTENVKDANEQIKQAIQRNAGLRVWSLFFLLVMSFALLFLDWYYD